MEKNPATKQAKATKESGKYQKKGKGILEKKPATKQVKSHKRKWKVSEERKRYLRKKRIGTRKIIYFR